MTKATTTERKAAMVEKEGVEQAKMWLGRGDLGDVSLQMSVAVLISTHTRASMIRGARPLELTP